MWHCRRHVALGLVAHALELRPLLGIRVFAEREDADAFLLHALARLGGHLRDALALFDEVELPEALATFLAVAATMQHPQPQLVEHPGPRRRLLRALIASLGLKSLVQGGKPLRRARARTNLGLQADEALGHLLPDRMVPARVADRRAVAHDDRARDAMPLVGVAHRPPVPA